MFNQFMGHQNQSIKNKNYTAAIRFDKSIRQSGHEIFIKKLEKYGINGVSLKHVLLNWITTESS